MDKLPLHERVARVRDTILERGFAKHALVLGDEATGSVCLRGAIGVVTSGKATRSCIQDRQLDRFLHDEALRQGRFVCLCEKDAALAYLPCPVDYGHVLFNNAEETTAADIDDFLREAERSAKELAS